MKLAEKCHTPESINGQLIHYIEENIISRYAEFDKAHDTVHVLKVICNSLKIAEDYNVNLDMVFAVAVYHDIGIMYGRENHNITSGDYLLKDNSLNKWFTDEQLVLMKDAVEDHRAGNDYEPRTIYGKIISEADRDIEVETILHRTLQFGIKNFPCLSFDEQFERAYLHIQDKYGVNGYIKLWLNTKNNNYSLISIRKMLNNKMEMKEECRRYLSQI